MLNAVIFYNNTYHSTIKCTPTEVHERKVDFNIIKERINKAKANTIGKRNKNRENYIETRTTGFIKNYKSLRHKEEPKFRKHCLTNVHQNNIKRIFKFADQNSSHMDTIVSNDPQDSSGPNN